MHEIIINTHVHTFLSDGHGTYQEIADAAIEAGVDGVIITDHNVTIYRKEGFFSHHGKIALILTGQEIHDQVRDPQKNHLLVFHSMNEYSLFAQNPAQLINKVKTDGGLSFLAHPVDPELKIIGEPDISWENWETNNFTGIELWNGFSEIKYLSHNYLQILFYSFFPKFLAHQPLPTALKLWDNLLQQGHPCVAIGSSDAHAIPKKAFWFHKIIFPYAFHFRSINNHLLLQEPLSPIFEKAEDQIYRALQCGNLFIGYDLPYPTRNFRFYGQAKNNIVQMGEQIDAGDGITFQINLPIPVECNLLKNGDIVKSWSDTRHCTYITQSPGVYRVEVYIQFLGKRRGWIFSNPIYVRRLDDK